ncbi:Flagellar hook-associated protein 1 [Koleobacter methoxysyntrophicus]|uniref:Flagellar hook-associated protein 1 n=1 Tax=Koleobacter methoxysyntrophicus TaxID=2751313 RepID=A0A8A0RR93_9FIRM|nr:flagellar hook-associated protein FlgK [Koleobacter methoxysyntrophicus]QSQ10412.1 Flagellar hook-associated protein 1 [Koleobacter methoxysyntrophicus]
MRSAFFGLEIAKRALFTHQHSLYVTGHNIANANTEGYSRQRGIHAATYPQFSYSLNRPTFAGITGTGVEMQEIRRMRDQFIDRDFRNENQIFGEWETKRDILQKIEYIFNEPSDSGIRSVLDEFWNSFQELSKNPENPTVRAVVHQRGIALAETINHTYTQFKELQMQVNEAIDVKVKEINSLSLQIADLNDQILKTEATGDNANDLRDRRDFLVDQLSKIVKLYVDEDNNGMYTISVTGAALVTGKYYNPIEFDVTDITSVITFTDLGYNLVTDGGELKGLLEMRDNALPYYMKGLEDIAQALMDEINPIHSTGFGLGDASVDPTLTGNDFFISGSGNNLIELNPALNVLERIAAASSNNTPGDGSNALLIAQLKQKKIATLANGTFDDYTKSLISALGVDTQEAIRMTDNQQLLLTQIENRRESVSGVSLDEEMSNMIKFQHGYNSAARMVTAIDEMLEVVVNKMGIVGR